MRQKSCISSVNRGSYYPNLPFINGKWKWNQFWNNLVVLIHYDMQNRKSIPVKKLNDLIQENKDFISAINDGASSDKLDEIRQRIKGKNEEEIPRINYMSSPQNPP